MIAFRSIASSLALNFLLFALMAVTVQTPLPINIPSKPIDFTWIDKKVEAVKSGAKIEKPIEILKPDAKMEVKPVRRTQTKLDNKPEPIVEIKRKPVPRPIAEPVRGGAVTPEVMEPESATVLSKDKIVKMDNKPYLGRKNLSSFPDFLDRHLPGYPPLARRMGREGEVMLEIWLEADGSIEKIVTVKSAGWGFDKAAIKAANLSRFTPGQMDGHPVRSKIRAPYIFRLE